MIKTYRVYGADGHRQKESFAPSHNFTDCNGVKYVVLNADSTGTNDYTIVIIEAGSLVEICLALQAQLDDGIFENYRYGKIEDLGNRSFGSTVYDSRTDEEISFVAAVSLMDEELLQEAEEESADKFFDFEKNQKIFDLYCVKHLEKYGTEFVIN